MNEYDQAGPKEPVVCEHCGSMATAAAGFKTRECSNCGGLMVRDPRPQRLRPAPNRPFHPALEPTPLLWRGKGRDVTLGEMDDLGILNCLRAIQTKIPEIDRRPRIWDGLVIEALRRGYGWAEWIDPLAP